MTRLSRLLVVLSMLMVPASMASGRLRLTAAQQTQGTVVARAVDSDGKPLPGACYVVVYSTSAFESGDPVCDGADGSDDGTTTIQTDYLSDSAVLMSRAPKGYIVGARLSYRVQAGGATKVSFKPKRGGQPVEITLLDHQQHPVTGACVRLVDVSPLGDFTGVAAIDCAGKTSRGRLTIEGVAPGHYAVIVKSDPKNFVEVASEHATFVKEKSGSKLILAFEPAGTVKLAVLGPDGVAISEPICVALRRASSGPPLTTVLCPSSTGEYISGNLPPGKYVVEPTGSSAPTGLAYPDNGPTFIITPKTQTNATYEFEAGGQPVVLTVVDPDGNTLQNGCATFQSRSASATDVVNFVCTGFPFWGMKPGKYRVRFATAPNAPVAAGPESSATVNAGSETDVTVRAAWSSTLIASARNQQNGKNLVGACFEARARGSGVSPQYVAVACDDADGKADGLVSFNSVPAGAKIDVLPMFVPAGWALPKPVSVTLNPGEKKTLALDATMESATTWLRRLDHKGAVVSGTCYAIYTSVGGKRGNLFTTRCDRQDFDGADGLTTLTSMPPGDYIAVETETPGGAKTAPNTAFTVIAGHDEVVIVAASHG